MVDTSAVGTTDDPFPMTVERGKIREFARATMSENPEYLERPVAADRADVPHLGVASGSRRASRCSPR